VTGRNEIAVFLGDGAGGFTSPPFTIEVLNPYALETADINGDGQLDLLVSSTVPDEIVLLLGSGDGTLTEQQRFSSENPSAIAAADFKDNGQIDFAAVSFNAAAAELWINITCVPSPDLNGDGVVNSEDLGALLAAWGSVD